MDDLQSIERIAFLLKQKTQSLNEAADHFSAALSDYTKLLVSLEESGAGEGGVSGIGHPRNAALASMIEETRVRFSEIFEAVDISLNGLKGRILSNEH